MNKLLFSMGLLCLALFSLLIVTSPPAYGGWGVSGCGPSMGQFPAGPVGPDPFQMPAQATSTGIFVLTVPEDARVFFNNLRTIQSGQVRRYETPPLEHGVIYHYDIRVEVGRSYPATDSRWVDIRAGQTKELSFDLTEPTSPKKDKKCPKCGDDCQCDDCQCCPDCPDCQDGHCHCKDNKCEKCPNYGVETDKISPRERYTVQGREVTSDEAHGLVGAPTLPDDKGLPFLIFKLDKTSLTKAQADIKAEPLASLVKNFRVQLYDLSDPMTNDRTGQLLYRPGVTITASDGKALSYTPSYTGPQALTVALRTVKPVQWEKVPDLTVEQPKPQPSPDSPMAPVDQAQIGLFLGSALLTGYFLLKK